MRIFAYDKNKFRRASLITISVCIIYLMHWIGVSEFFSQLLSCIVVWCGTATMLVEICKKCYREEIFIILAGYLIRLAVVLIDLYGRSYVSIPHSGLDTEGFFTKGVEFYNGNVSFQYLGYPYIINGIFHIAGINRFIAQYVNVIFWFASMMVLRQCCNLMNIQKNYQRLALCLLAFSPNYIFLTSSLERESIISFFILLSFLFFLKWMKIGNLRNLVYAFFALLPSIILHTSAIAIAGGYMVLIAFYDKRKKHCRLQIKSWFVLLIGMGCIRIIFAVPGLRSILLTYIPSLDKGIIGVANRIYQIKKDAPGGSDYLTEQSAINNYGNLIWRTLQRMVYFIASPTPNCWRGMKDVIAFLMDSLFYIIAVLTSIWSMIKKKSQSDRTALQLLVLCFVGFCAWGVSNAGTAMRHRDKILGIVVLLFTYSLQMIKTKEGINE